MCIIALSGGLAVSHRTDHEDSVVVASGTASSGRTSLTRQMSWCLHSTPNSPVDRVMKVRPRVTNYVKGMAWRVRFQVAARAHRDLIRVRRREPGACVAQVLASIAGRQGPSVIRGVLTNGPSTRPKGPVWGVRAC